MTPLLLSLGLVACLGAQREQNSSPKTPPATPGSGLHDTAQWDGDTGGQDSDDGPLVEDSGEATGDSGEATGDSGGTAVSDPVEPSASDLVLTELMINPAFTADADGEWIELLNATAERLLLSGCTFKDADLDRCEITNTGGGRLVVEPGARVVVCANTDSDTNGGVDCDGSYAYLTTGGGCALANSDDEVILLNPDEAVIDRFHYDNLSDPDFVPMGASLGVDEAFATESANDKPQHWCAQRSLLPSGDYGTPGAENDPCG